MIEKNMIEKDEDLLLLSDRISDCEINIERAKAILCMIIEKYSFSYNDEYAKTAIEAIRLDAYKIITYLYIALDYVVATEAGLIREQEMIKVQEDRYELL